MDVLVVGGTRFVGRAIVEAARGRGADVTLFNRGNRADVFPELPLIEGDRDRPEDLARLSERTWDAVIDTCAYRPPQVRALLEALAGQPHYTLISTISVYADASEGGPDEKAPVHPPLVDGEVTGETYGALKVGCERAADGAGVPLLIVRPGLVAGPHDPTDRFTYWPVRVAAGGEVLAPGGPDVDVQWIDVRDLGAFVAASVEATRTGTFNVVNPPGRDSLGGLLAASATAAGTAPEWVWADESFLLDQGVAPFRDLPLWVPADDRGLMRTSNARAAAAGLVCRPTIQTVRDTLAWARTDRGDGAWSAGLDADRERRLIEAWRSRS